MKNFIIRSVLFLLMIVLANFNIWFAVFFALIFIVFFNWPAEAFIGFFIFETITGFPYGTLLLPLIAALIMKHFIFDILKQKTFFSGTVLFAGSFLAFFVVHLIFMLFIGGVGILGFPIFLEI